jgi:hypothetical protein
MGTNFTPGVKLHLWWETHVVKNWPQISFNNISSFLVNRGFCHSGTNVCPFSRDIMYNNLLSPYCQLSVLHCFVFGMPLQTHEQMCAKQAEAKEFSP